jgi:hypothetical protein
MSETNTVVTAFGVRPTVITLFTLVLMCSFVSTTMREREKRQWLRYASRARETGEGLGEWGVMTYATYE